MKRIVFLIMVVGLVGIVGCGKDDGGENGGNGGNGGNGEVVKHNVELVFGDNSTENWQHIELDTIRKYNDDPTVDTIFLVPEDTLQYATFSGNGMRNVSNKLRERKNVNPEKVWGKGKLVINPMVTYDNPEIVRFFRDTMGYQLKY